MDIINTISYSRKILNFGELPTKISNAINITLGAFSGVLALTLIVTLIFYFVKLSFSADSHFAKQKYLNAIKWVTISFIAILVIWALSGAIIAMMQTSLIN